MQEHFLKKLWSFPSQAIRQHVFMVNNRYLIWLIGTLLLFGGELKSQSNGSKSPLFTFAFLTDIHVQPERRAEAGFARAIQMVNELNPDFVITGGDLIYDALGKSYPRADSLYTIYDSLQRLFNMPVYNTIGNHEVFGLYEKSGVEVTHPEFGKKMFENRIGKRYYSFDRNNWHFMILDDIGFTDDRKYFAQVDSLQMEWIEHDLAKLAPNTNIIVSAHIPFETVFINHYFKNQGLSDSGIVVTNGPEVLQLFEGKNLKLVLQGHTHVLEDVFIDGIHFVTGGAVSAHWWRGPNFKTEEGFLLVKVYKDTFAYEYIDINWEVKSAE